MILRGKLRKRHGEAQTEENMRCLHQSEISPMKPNGLPSFKTHQCGMTRFVHRALLRYGIAHTFSSALFLGVRKQHKPNLYTMGSRKLGVLGVLLRSTFGLIFRAIRRLGMDKDHVAIFDESLRKQQMVTSV